MKKVRPKPVTQNQVNLFMPLTWRGHRSLSNQAPFGAIGSEVRIHQKITDTVRWNKTALNCRLLKHLQDYLLTLGFPRFHFDRKKFPHPAHVSADHAHASYLADMTGEEHVHVLVFPFQLIGNRDERARGLRVIWFLKEQRQAHNSSCLLKKVIASRHSGPERTAAASLCSKASSSLCLIKEQQSIWSFMCFLKKKPLTKQNAWRKDRVKGSNAACLERTSLFLFILCYFLTSHYT